MIRKAMLALGIASLSVAGLAAPAEAAPRHVSTVQATEASALPWWIVRSHRVKRCYPLRCAVWHRYVPIPR